MAQTLASLRAEVRAAHRLATKKVSRLRSKGVEIGGSNIDPRRDLSRIKGYTTRQLQTYLAELEHFRSRRTQFYTGATQNIISGRKWAEYKQLERQYNEQVRRANRRVGDIVLPEHGVTIRERDAMLRSDFPIMQGGRRPFDMIQRNISGIVSERALDVLTRDMRRRLSPDYEAREIRAQRRIARDMMKDLSVEQRRSLRGLTDKQFNVLWNYTNFSTRLKFVYENLKDSTKEWVARTAEDAEGSVDELISWASTL